jgi:hypothetical protein
MLQNPVQNAQQQHKHTFKEKTMFFVGFIIHYLPCMKQKI